MKINLKNNKKIIIGLCATLAIASSSYTGFALDKKPVIKKQVKFETDYQRYSFYNVKELNNGGYINVGMYLSDNIFERNYNETAVISKFDDNGKIVWEHLFEGDYEDTYNDVCELSDGSLIAIGNTRSSYLYDYEEEDFVIPIDNKGGSDGFISKYDKDGNLLWSKNWGGSEYDIFNSLAVLPNGDLLAVGETLSQDINDMNNKGNSDIAVVLFDKDGNIKWNKAYGGSGWDTGSYVTLTNDSILISGYTGSSELGVSDNSDYGYILKLDFNGNVLLEKAFSPEGYDTYISPAREDSDGNIISTGYYDKGEIGSSFLIKLKPDGTEIFTSTLEGYFNDVLLADDGGYLVVGSLDNQVDDMFVPSETGVEDSVIIKYSNDGNIEWINSYGIAGGDSILSISNGKEGDLLALRQLSKDYSIEMLHLTTFIKEQASKDLDVQVVADNTLEMALSTNQISFTGYNGTQDLINNDLNITVSSGLNYDLNAKLNDELRGTNDITAIIDKSNLKIKTLTDTDYKEFTTIGTPITLVENASNGKNNVHNINFKLLGDSSVKVDTYNTSITFEAVQK